MASPGRTPMWCHGTRPCGIGSYVLRGSSASSRVRVESTLSPEFAVQRGDAQVSPLRRQAVSAAVCNLCRPCAAGHASPVAPRPVIGGASCRTTKVGGAGICG